jgi:hypothetical protein
MKILLATLAISGLLTCQTPVPTEVGVTVEAKTTQDPKPEKQPAKVGEAKESKQDPAKKDAAKQDPAKQDPAKKTSEGDGSKKPVGKGDKEKEEPRIDRPEKDQPIPVGTDPADIAAMKSAEDMLRAEKRLQEEIKAGKIKGLDKILPFDELTSWPYEDALKGMPKRVKELSGKKVLMTGFMLPIDEVQNIKEFLLVESLWSCCYGQPPDIHGIVRVVMPKTKTTDYFFDPLKLIGTFKVEATMMDGYCVDIYQLHCESLEALKFK